MRIPPRQLAGLVLLASIWGASFMFIKVLLDEVEPVEVGWLRLGGGAVFLAVVMRVRGRPLPRDGRYWRSVLVVGALGSALPFFVIPRAEQEISSQLAGILNGAMPLWAAVLTQLVLVEERLSRSAAAGMVVGFIGLGIVIGPGIFDLGDASTQGALMMLGAALSYAASAVWVRRRLQGVDSTTLAGIQTLLAFLYLTPWAAAGGLPNPATFPANVLWSTIALGVLATGVAYVIYYWLLATVHATQAALVTYLAPVAAVFWGWAILDESLGRGVWPGLVLIVIGMYLVNRPARVATERAMEDAARVGATPGSASAD
jgi:drug/metabolite transporter (DMT)-like permease